MSLGSLEPYKPLGDFPLGLHDSALTKVAVLPGSETEPDSRVVLSFSYRSAEEGLELLFCNCHHHSLSIDLDVQLAEEPWNVFGVYEVTDSAEKQRYVSAQLAVLHINYKNLEVSNDPQSSSSDRYPNPKKLSDPDSYRLYSIKLIGGRMDVLCEELEELPFASTTT